MIKKITQIIIILAGLLLLSFSLAAVAFHLVFPAAKLKKMITDGIRYYVYRDVALGDISVNVLRGVTVSDFAVSEYAGFRTGTLLAVRKIAFDLRAFPLLQKRFIVGTLNIDSPRLSIVQEKNGTLNLDNLLIASPGQETNWQTLAPFLLISKCRLTGGELDFISRKLPGHEVRIKDIALAVNDISLDAPFGFELSAILTAEHKNFDLAGKGTASLKEKTITIDEAVLKGQGSLVNLSGSLGNVFGAEEMSVDLKLKSEGPLLSALFLPFPSLGDVQVGGLSSMDVFLSGPPKDLNVKIIPRQIEKPLQKK